MRKQAQSGSNNVQPGKQVVAVVPRNRRAGRKSGHARRSLVPQRDAQRGVQGRFDPLNPQALILKAIAKGDLSTVEKLLQLQRDFRAEIAKRQYMEALARFQRICPIIEKTKKVDFTNRKGINVRWQYAPLEVIIRAVQKPLSDCGFSFMLKGDQKENDFTAITEGYHVGGHMEVNRITVPISKEEYMSAPHAVASAQMFASRRSFCFLFGIVTADTDDDAQSAGITSENGAKAQQRAEQPSGPSSLPEDPDLDNVEKLLKQMTWLDEKALAMFRKQAKNYVERKDKTSLRGLQQSLSKQIATKGAKK